MVNLAQMKKIALLQSNYIPWKGVFDLIHAVDCFIFYDSADFTRRDWRSRNRIKTADGPQWLTVPVEHAPRGTPIGEIRICRNQPWRERHRRTIERAYARAPFFAANRFLLDEIYGLETDLLSEFNIAATRLLARHLGCRTEFDDSRRYHLPGVKDDKIIALCRAVGADGYLSGPAAKDYIVPEKFRAAGIGLEYIRYDYPVYPQLHGAFDPFVSVLDVIFNCGPAAPAMIFRGRTESGFIDLNSPATL